jgi:hypothetical protein
MRFRWFFLGGLATALAVAAVIVPKRSPGIDRSTPHHGRRSGTESRGSETAMRPGPASVGGRVSPPGPAKVQYYDYGKGDEPAATTVAGEDGAFRFAEIVGKRGVILAQADGFLPAWLAMPDLGDVNITLEPGEPLPYRVTDSEGNGVAGAQVEIWYRHSPSGHFTRDRLSADARGVFTASVGVGERFTITATGFEPRTVAQPDLGVDPRKRTVVLTPLLRVAGRVVDPLGQPVVAGEVRCREEGDTRTPWGAALAARVDADGRFETPPLRPRQWEVRAAAPGWAEARALVWPGDAGVELRLERPVRIEGRVLLPGGAPGQGVELWARGADPLTHTAADGSFRLDGIPPGMVELLAYWWGPVNGTEGPDGTEWRCSWSFDLKPGESRTGIELTLSGAHYSWVPLRLIDDRGAALKGVHVDTGSVLTFGDDRPTTDVNGFVLIRVGLPPGQEVSLRFRGHGPYNGIDRSSRIRTLPAGTADVVEVKIPAPARVVFVVRDVNGAPIPPEANPVVLLDPGGKSPVDGERVEVLVAPDLDDPYVEYLVCADGFATTGVEDWIPNPAGETIEVRLNPSAILRGKLAGADGAPLAGFHVDCLGWRGVETDHAGVFGLDWLPPGPTLLRVAEAETCLPLLRRRLELRAGVNDIGLLTRPPPAIVRGRVTDASGRALGGATVEFLEVGRVSELVATTRPDGTFSFSVCEPEKLRVIARKAGFGAALGGGDMDLQMVLPRDGTLRLQVPPEINWAGVRITLPDGSEIRPVYGDRDKPDTLELLQLPLGPLTIDFVSDPRGRITASCTDRSTVVPRR